MPHGDIVGMRGACLDVEEPILNVLGDVVEVLDTSVSLRESCWQRVARALRLMA